MSERVLVLGAGGHARTVIDVLRAAGHAVVAVFDDDPSRHGQELRGVCIAGGFEDVTAFALRGGLRHFIVAIGDNEARLRLARRLEEEGLQPLAALHPAAVIAPGIEVGGGTVVMPGACISADACVGKHVIVNAGVCVDHDCRIGDGVHLAPGAVLCSGVTVGEQTLVGAGSTAVSRIALGRRVTVGAGVVVSESVADNMSSRGCQSALSRSESMSYSNAPWPLFEDDEVEAVEAVLRSGKVNYWTGTVAREFEKAYAEYVGVPHAIAVANGTVALDLAWIALGIGKGDEVVVTSRTFLASVSSIVLAGATPVFADIDPDSQNITTETIRAVLSPRTKAILCVHLAGWPCDMAGILALAREHGLKVVEDCAQAHGARYQGEPVGSFGDIAAFSFCQDKIMSTGGEGGLVTCRDDALWSKMWSFKDHGKSFDAVYHRQHPPGFRWLHESFGTNWRITEMQAAIGLRQLAKLDDWVARRRANMAALFAELQGLATLRVPQAPSDVYHAAYRAYAFVRPDRLRPDWSRDRIMQAVVAAGVPCMSGSSSEVYRESAFDGTGLRPARPLPVAQELGETSLAFLVHPTLSPDDLCEVGRIARTVIQSATR